MAGVARVEAARAAAATAATQEEVMVAVGWVVAMVAGAWAVG